jgi:hypothetical protein
MLKTLFEVIPLLAKEKDVLCCELLVAVMEPSLPIVNLGVPDLEAVKIS